MSTESTADYSFITDRLAIGSLASRSTPGFVAVVSVVTVEGRHRGRPWSAELTAKAPQVPGGEVVEPCKGLQGKTWGWTVNSLSSVPVLVIDIADGESSRARSHHTSICDRDPRDEEWTCAPQCLKRRGHEDDRDLDFYLDDAMAFIAANIKRGCVLVHCGAGLSRSVSVVIAYLCRYAGMSYSEALSLVKARRPGAAPADCFKFAIERWLSLRELSEKGPRR